MLGELLGCIVIYWLLIKLLVNIVVEELFGIWLYFLLIVRVISVLSLIGLVCIDCMLLIVMLVIFIGVFGESVLMLVKWVFIVQVLFRLLVDVLVLKNLFSIVFSGLVDLFSVSVLLLFMNFFVLLNCRFMYWLLSRLLVNIVVIELIGIWLYFLLIERVMLVIFLFGFSVMDFIWFMCMLVIFIGVCFLSWLMLVKWVDMVQLGFWCMLVIEVVWVVRQVSVVKLSMMNRLVLMVQDFCWVMV